MDMPAVRHVLLGSGEQRKMEQTGCEIICGIPTAPAVTRRWRWRSSLKQKLHNSKSLFSWCLSGRQNVSLDGLVKKLSIKTSHSIDELNQLANETVLYCCEHTKVVESGKFKQMIWLYGSLRHALALKCWGSWEIACQNKAKVIKPRTVSLVTR